MVGAARGALDAVGRLSFAPSLSRGFGWVGYPVRELSGGLGRGRGRWQVVGEAGMGPAPGRRQFHPAPKSPTGLPFAQQISDTRNAGTHG